MKRHETTYVTSFDLGLTRRKRNRLRRKYNAARRTARPSVCPMYQWRHLPRIQLRNVKRICKYQKG